MSLYKRNKTWWTEFSINGQRYRQSLDTSDWREGQHKEKELNCPGKPRETYSFGPELCPTSFLRSR